MRMKRLLVKSAPLLAAALAVFGLAYYFSSGGVAGFRGLGGRKEAPLPAPKTEGGAGYRIRLMEETAPEKGWKESQDEVKETREERPGAVIIRRPLGGINLMVLLDGSEWMASEAGSRSFE
jgi:hypothetical protein